MAERPDGPFTDFDPRNFALFSSRELLDPKQAAIAKQLSLQFMRDPDLLRSVEKVTAQVREQLSEEQQTAALKSFGWTDEEIERALPSPKQAAAAVGAAAAALAGGPGVAAAVAA